MPPAPVEVAGGDDDDDESVRVRAIESYTAEDGALVELSFKVGDILLAFTEREVPDGWVHALQMSSGEEGLIPEAYVELIGDDDDDSAGQDADGTNAGRQSGNGTGAGAVEQSGAPASADEADEDEEDEEDEDGEQVMEVVEHFTPQEGALNELEIRKGQLVVVMPSEQPEGWTLVKMTDSDLNGLVPTAYLDVPPKRKKNAQEVEIKRARERVASLEQERDALRNEMTARIDALQTQQQQTLAVSRLARPPKFLVGGSSRAESGPTLRGGWPELRRGGGEGHSVREDMARTLWALRGPPRL